MPTEKKLDNRIGSLLPPWSLALLSGLLLVGATPGLGDSRIAGFIGFVPLYMALRNGSPVRAIENRKALIRVATSGISTIIDPVGRMVQRADVGERKALISRVALLKVPTIFSMIGNTIWWLVLTVLVGAACLDRLRKI